MEQIKNITEFFLFSLSFGTHLFSPLTGSKDTGVGFLKLIQGVGGGALLIGLLVLLTHTQLSWTSYLPILLIGGLTLAILLSFFPYLIPDSNMGRAFWRILFWTKTVIFLGITYGMSSGQFSQFFFYLSTTLFLGSVVYGMILGHWYLVVPKLSERPLLVVMKWTWLGLGIKGLFSLWALITGWDEFSAHPLVHSSYSFSWLLLIMRFLWGYVAILILSIFTWKLIKMRSIQSATGTLYIMVFFLFVGEIISAYLYYSYGFLV